MRLRFQWYEMSLLLGLSAGLAWLAWDGPPAPAAAPAPVPVPTRAALPEGDLRVGDYRIRFEETGPGAFVEIRRGEEVVERLEGGRYAVGRLSPKADEVIPPGTDVTGDGTPDLVVFEHTGGVHCCNFLSVYELGPRFRTAAHLHGSQSGFAMSDMDGDGVAEIRLRDWSFAYWRYPSALSPSAPVVLQYRDGEYRVALDLMRTPPLGVSEQARVVGQLREVQDEPALFQSRLTGQVLNLVASGNADQAWEIADQVGEPGFREEFLEQLRESPYLGELAR